MRTGVTFLITYCINNKHINFCMEIVFSNINYLFSLERMRPVAGYRAGDTITGFITATSLFYRSYYNRSHSFYDNRYLCWKRILLWF